MSGQKDNPVQADPDPAKLDALRAVRQESDLRKVSILNATDRSLILRLLVQLVCVRILLLRRDYAGTRQVLERKCPPARREDDLEGNTFWLACRAGRIANGLARRMPFDAACLVRSFAVWSILRREGVPVDLRIGVAKQNDFEAHAWVELLGEPVTDTNLNIARFEVFERSWY